MGWVPESMWLSLLRDLDSRRRPCGTTSRCRRTRTPAVGADGRLLGAASSNRTEQLVDPRCSSSGAARVVGGGRLARWRGGERSCDDVVHAAHRLVMTTVAVVLVVLGAGAEPSSWRTAGASVASTTDGVLGPGQVTVRIDVDHSHFRVAAAGPSAVLPHTEVRFVVVNHDPIGHELIVGGPDVQARHAHGHEAYHPPVPGEVSVPGRGPGVDHLLLPRTRAGRVRVPPPRSLPVRHARHRRGGGGRGGSLRRLVSLSDSTAMELRPFGTLTIVTDPDGLFFLGTTSAGKRIIQELKSVQLDGRVQGTMVGKAAADWLTVDDAGNVTLDIRVLLTTDDGAQVYVHLDGRAQWPERLGDGPIYSARHARSRRRALRVGEPPAAGVEGRGRPRRWRRPRALRTRLTHPVLAPQLCLCHTVTAPKRRGGRTAVA